MKKRTLEIDEDVAFQRKEWLAQRVGIGLLFTFVLAALLGLTGTGGPLSHAEAADPAGAVRLEYERVVRRGSVATLTLHLKTRDAAPARFWISSPYFHHARLETITPSPETVVAEPGRHVYTLQSGSPDLTVILEVEHKTVGRISGEVGLVDGPLTRFNQVSLF